MLLREKVSGFKEINELVYFPDCLISFEVTETGDYPGAQVTNIKLHAFNSNF